MSSIIRGVDGFDSSTRTLIASSDDVSSSGDSLGQNIVCTFDDAKMVVINFALQPSDDNFAMRVRVGSGGTVDTGTNYGYFSGFADMAASPTYNDSGAASGAGYWSLGAARGASGDETIAGTIRIYVVDNGTVERVSATWETVSSSTSDVGTCVNGAGVYRGTQFPTNAFEIYHDGATDSWSAGWYNAIGYK